MFTTVLLVVIVGVCIPGAAVTAPNTTCDWEKDVDFYGNDFQNLGPLSMDECCQACWSNPDCSAVTYNFGPPGPNDQHCNLKYSNAGRRTSVGEYSVSIRPNRPSPPPPPKPLPPNPNQLPSSWQSAIGSVDMLVGAPTSSSVGYQGVHIGNGYLSSSLSSQGSQYIAGVFSGNGTSSQRAQIPSFITGAELSTSNMVQVGGALDMARGAFMRLYNITQTHLTPETDTNEVHTGHGATWQPQWVKSTQNASDVPGGTCVVRQYAHRQHMHVSVFDLTCNTEPLTSPVQFAVTFNRVQSGDVTAVVVPTNSSANCTLYTINTPEEPWSSKVEIVVCTHILSATSTVSVPLGGIFTTHLVSAQYTSVDNDGQSNTTQAIVGRALQDLDTYTSETPDGLFATHSKATALLLASGPTVYGNHSIAAAVNSSRYALMTTVRQNVTYSSSPGGLATNSYHGHTFWDVETWMWPSWNVFYPRIARDVLQYRADRIDAARSHAAANNYDGTMFPWESAFTGQEVDPASGTTIEEHIQGDISFAFYQHWMVTKDVTWLKTTGFAVLEGIARFWASKAVKNTDGSYSIPDIMGPDEYHGPVRDSVYCNVIAKMSFLAAYDLAPVVGQQQNVTFQTIANNLVILFNEKLQYHPEFEGYIGEKVKQADTILLGYPLNYNMSSAVRGNDLKFYAAVTDVNGPAMTWSMFSIGYRDIGDFATAAQYFTNSYANNVNGDYLVWSEVKGGGGAANFITGVGGFLQCVWAGYGGIRVHDDRLEISSPQPLPGSTGLTLTDVYYMGHTLTLNIQQASWSVVDTTVPTPSSWLLLNSSALTKQITASPITLPGGVAAYITSS